jgi:hypothetical protein
MTLRERGQPPKDETMVPDTFLLPTFLLPFCYPDTFLLPRARDFSSGTAVRGTVMLLRKRSYESVMSRD